MPNSNRLVVGLLSHYLIDVNLGCVALSISNMKLLDEAAERLGLDIEFVMVVNEKHPEVQPSFTTTPTSYRYFESSKRTLRHPIRYLRSTVFDDCDLVVNINAGDGFTDLYGFQRLISESYMSLLAQRKGVPTVMAPQTIGPFDRRASRVLAKRVLKGCSTVFSRDRLSTDLCHELGLKETVEEVIDVAFALPFTKTAINGRSNDGLAVGVNVSGLLYRGGYDQKNYFELNFDYKEFVHELVGRLAADGHAVHLISHVTAEPGSIEDDYSACEDVAQLFPSAILAPRFEDAIQVKSYIAGLDYFTGARMHSTIGAFSAGVPVVPIGYSKKLKGLYDTLGYPYYIDARESQWTAVSAVDQVLAWLGQLPDLQESLDRGAEVFETRLEKYKVALTQIMQQTAHTKARG